ncbi:peptidoglycan-binding domain-containing protein [Hyphomicrobium sp. LHD-15]|uniref:peptidoglycan-binding domain-containing protein n=1 Tax=Hyphomicrobium sp. LHD-15 TaxID=3072142 RepID=UPI00280E57DB|nr:peptidoglycan-binding domain-containing protein [Hyphomicrobium sp. LHD-15]MDQ8700622.1 peptidoglycan-binding domain-containing protein [Hyphomicrobium sp. LHD-15]
MAPHSLTGKSRFHAICVAVAVFCMLVPPIGPAKAGSRGVGVGIGVGAGLQILNQLSKGTTASKGTAKKRTATGTSKKTTKKAKQPRDNGGEEKITSKDKDASEQTQVEAAAEKQPSPPAAASAAAAAAAVAAPTVTGAVPTVAGPAPNLISTKEEVTSAQEHLRYLGYDVPTTTGVLDLNTKIAIMKFQDSIGAQATGGLTVEQLQRLYARADEQQKRAK